MTSDNYTPQPILPGREFVDFNATPSTTPTPPSHAIKSVNDLVKVLSDLQNRVNQLESENSALQNALAERITKKETLHLLTKLDSIRLPKSGLVSDSFFMRALSVYGHWLVINILLSIVFTILTFALLAALGLPLSTLQNLPR